MFFGFLQNIEQPVQPHTKTDLSWDMRLDKSAYVRSMLAVHYVKENQLIREPTGLWTWLMIPKGPKNYQFRRLGLQMVLSMSMDVPLKRTSGCRCEQSLLCVHRTCKAPLIELYTIAQEWSTYLLSNSRTSFDANHGNMPKISGTRTLPNTSTYPHCEQKRLKNFEGPMFPRSKPYTPC